MRHFPIFMDLQGRRGLRTRFKAKPRTARQRSAAALRRRRGAGGDRLRGPEQLDGNARSPSPPRRPRRRLTALVESLQTPGASPSTWSIARRFAASSRRQWWTARPSPSPISSGGAAPVLARLIRARIEAAGASLPSADSPLVADEFKAELRRRLPNVGPAPPSCWSGRLDGRVGGPGCDAGQPRMRRGPRWRGRSPGAPRTDRHRLPGGRRTRRGRPADDAGASPDG